MCSSQLPLCLLCKCIMNFYHELDWTAYYPCSAPLTAYPLGRFCDLSSPSTGSGTTASTFTWTPSPKVNVTHSTPTYYLFKRAPLLGAAVQLSSATISIALEITMWLMMRMAGTALVLEEMSSRASNSLPAVHNNAYSI